MENETLKQKAEEFAQRNDKYYQNGETDRDQLVTAFLAGASFVSQNRDEEIEKLNMIIRDCRASITGHKDEIQSMEREIQILEKTIDGYLNKKE